METPWVIERLESWIEQAESARRTGNPHSSDKKYTFGYQHDPKMIALRAQHDQVRRIVAKVLRLKQAPILLRKIGTNEAFDLVDGIIVCREALGRVRTDAETREKLGSTAPVMAADRLHPEVWVAAARRWEAGNYSDAVQRAATYLNANIQDLTGRHDISDSELMKQVFSLSPATEGKQRLRWPGDGDNLSVKTMRVGILNYAQGLFSTVRNIATHSTSELTEQVALEQLSAISVLARWVDECELEDCTS